ncbi:hypothetical protein TTHERM_00039030 (macronuclear) [Tetrahymena thermophila SB210]|uniref:EF hand protein n=1 Tax=Tetrahymena thermophila (strain SB210) TaxID=312017 RepID=Q22M16_TETTS|nr:hypothetical protein TTHERM_00039030 [Tetrahymena thermophila SB210]EAR86252.2 hypothetical protein TTHERM_00039030 [Tetrahymena thermophila SB210]|eukprot:XP_977204.2 hypothetical protein TTHERM_00039030 [Tetrahymena thermophila SB210]
MNQSFRQEFQQTNLLKLARAKFKKAILEQIGNRENILYEEFLLVAKKVSFRFSDQKDIFALKYYFNAHMKLQGNGVPFYDLINRLRVKEKNRQEQYLIYFEVPESSNQNKSNYENEELKNMSQSQALNKSLLCNSTTQSRRGSTLLESSQMSNSKNKQFNEQMSVTNTNRQIPIAILQELIKSDVQRSDLKYVMDQLNSMEKSQGGEGQVDTDKFWSSCKNSFGPQQQEVMRKVINYCSIDGYVSYVKLVGLNNAYNELTESDNVSNPQNKISAQRVQTENPRQKRSQSVAGDYVLTQPYKKLSIPEQIQNFKIYVQERMNGPKNAFNVLDKDLKGYFTQNDFLIVFKNSRSELGHQELINVFKSLNSISSKKCGQIDFSSFYSFFQMPVETLIQYLPGGNLHHPSQSIEQLQQTQQLYQNQKLLTEQSQIEAMAKDYLPTQVSDYDESHQFLTPLNQKKAIKFDSHSPNRNLIGEYKTMYPQDYSNSGDKQITSYEMKRVVKNNPLVRNQRHTDFNYRRNVDPVPSDINPDYRYGIVKQQVDTMQNLVEGNYGRAWLESSIANQRERIQRIVNSRRMSQEKSNENTANIIRTEYIKDGINQSHLRSISNQKEQTNNLWKITKFRNTQGKITTNWSPEEQNRFPARLKTEGQGFKNNTDNYQELLEGFVVNKANLIKQTDRQNKSVLY